MSLNKFVSQKIQKKTCVQIFSTGYQSLKKQKDKSKRVRKRPEPLWIGVLDGCVIEAHDFKKHSPKGKIPDGTYLIIEYPFKLK